MCVYARTWYGKGVRRGARKPGGAIDSYRSPKAARVLAAAPHFGEKCLKKRSFVKASFSFGFPIILILVFVFALFVSPPGGCHGLVSFLSVFFFFCKSGRNDSAASLTQCEPFVPPHGE